MRPRRLSGAVAAVAALLLAVAGPALAARPPALSAPSAILMEASSGTVLYARRPDERRPIASTTKIMTVLLTLELARLSLVVTAPSYPSTSAESRIGIVAGERLTVADLVRAALLPSANDAAETLAVRIGGSRVHFVALMNARARRLHLRRTHYDTPVGLDDPANYSTARDLAHLAIVLRRNRFARRTMDRPRLLLRSGAHPRLVVNRNDLVARVPWINGVKTGHTLGAGYVLVGSGTRHGMTLVSVVLGTPSEAARDADTLALLRWGFAHFRLVGVLGKGRAVARRPVGGRSGSFAAVSPARGVRLVVARGGRTRVSLRLPARLEGPLPRRALVGHALVSNGGRVVARVPLLTTAAVPGPSFASTAGGVLRALLEVVVLLGAVLGITALALRRRARRPTRRTA